MLLTVTSKSKFFAFMNRSTYSLVTCLSMQHPQRLDFLNSNTCFCSWLYSNFNFETAYKLWVHKCLTLVYILKSTKKRLKNDRWGNLLWQMYWLMFSCASQQLAFSSQYYVAFFLVNMCSSWAKQFFYDESLSRNHTNRCSLRNLYAQSE